ncbi:MAG: ribosome maturation factor RimM [Zoogloeaceae bacterium]|nr:ribosome maturation factor RimM [Zoogloeaceae bacterium]
MPPARENEIVILGRALAPYGLKGWIRIKPFGDDPEEWRKMPTWWLGDTETGPWRKMELRGLEKHGDTLIAAFADIVDRDTAEAVLQGRWVGAPRTTLPIPAENEFYWGDLMGMTVVNMADVTLGKIQGLIETGANDVLRIVDAAGMERLLPFVNAVVKDVDASARRVRVDWEADWQ